MTEQKQQDTIIRLDDVRCAFPAFFKAEQVGGQGKPAFSGTFLMTPEHPALEIVKAAIKKVAVEKWGDEAAAVLAIGRE